MNLINWDELEHAYGSASDIPKLLKELEKYPHSKNFRDEPFFSLWSSLCHQGTVYSASFAAVPVLVSIIEKATGPLDYNYYLLPISIHIAYLQNKSYTIPESLAHQYGKAIEKLPALAAKEHPENELMLRVLSTALAVKKGNVALAQAILELDTDTLEEFDIWLQSR